MSKYALRGPGGLLIPVDLEIVHGGGGVSNGIPVAR